MERGLQEDPFEYGVSMPSKDITSHALLHVIDEWKVDFDNVQPAGVVLMDLNKAFDAICHGLFIAKLQTY